MGRAGVECGAGERSGRRGGGGGGREVDADRAVAEAFHLCGVVGDEQDRSVAAQGGHGLLDRVAASLVEGAGGLVEQQGRRFESQGPGEAESLLSLTESGGQPTLDRAATGPAPTGRAVVNARVACEPDALDAAVTEAVAAADGVAGVTSSATTPVSFKPSYPRPVHRLAPAGA